MIEKDQQENFVELYMKRIYAKQEEFDSNKTNLFLKDLRPDVTNEELKAAFATFGETNNVATRTPSNQPKMADQPKAMGFVNFEDKADAKKAQTEGHNVEEIRKLFIEGRPYITFWQPKPQHDKFKMARMRNVYNKGMGFDDQFYAGKAPPQFMMGGGGGGRSWNPPMAQGILQQYPGFPPNQNQMPRNRMQQGGYYMRGKPRFGGGAGGMPRNAYPQTGGGRPQQGPRGDFNGGHRPRPQHDGQGNMPQRHDNRNRDAEETHVPHFLYT